MLFAVLLPLLGTTLGAACVFAPKAPQNHAGLHAFAAGVMTAASVWSLILPALEQAADTPLPAFVPVLAGIWLGFGFLYLTEQLPARENRSLLTFAVALHNFPEGMAVGAAVVACQTGSISSSAVLALSMGIAIQNLPEGAIISLPLRAKGCSRIRSFGWGTLSGIIEPIGSLLTIWLASLALPALPWVLGFAAGAMLYVVAEELLPEAAPGKALHFGLGFTLMMLLDVALG